MVRLQVERLGGIAGLGGPLSRIRSSGEIDWHSLSAADRQTVESLFESHAPPAKRSRTRSTPGAKPATRGRIVPAARGGTRPAPACDAFTYRISRETADGIETIEVPEAVVPPAVSGCVHDELI